MQKIFNRGVHFINHYVGWRNWAVLVYNSVMENMFVIFFIALRKELYTPKFIMEFIVFLLFSSFCTTYGYLINDLGDKELDASHGKDNTFKSDSYLKACLIVLFFFLISVVFSFPFILNPFFLQVFIVWLLITTAYSIKPFRLKEKGKIGLIFVVIAQRGLPTLLIFFAFNYYEVIDIIIFTSYIFFRGLSSDLNHQLEDYKNDYITKTKTYAVETGFNKTKKAFVISLEIERVSLVLCILIMFFRLNKFHFYNIPLLLPLLLITLFMYGIIIKKKLSDNELNINPFISKEKDIFQFIHHGFPSVVLPLFLLLILITKRPIFIGILVFYIFIRRLYSIDIIKNSYPFRILMKK